jgi:hypothetical protein
MFYQWREGGMCGVHVFDARGQAKEGGMQVL